MTHPGSEWAWGRAGDEGNADFQKAEEEMSHVDNVKPARRKLL